MTPVLEALTESALRDRRPPGETVRHHVLEGILRRLSRLPEPEGFVLRGGMLARWWARPRIRPAQDLDFVGTFAFDVAKTAQRFGGIWHAQADDGVVFEPRSFRAKGIWLDTEFPGVRLQFRAGLEKPDTPLQIDVGFRDPLVPAAQPVSYPPTVGEPFMLWCVRPETAIGWKLHGLAERGPGRWRAKDLFDIFLILERAALWEDDLRLAIAVAFTSRGYTVQQARAVLTSENWWDTPEARALWQAFCTASFGLEVPEDLSAVVAAVRSRLLPTVEELGG